MMNDINWQKEKTLILTQTDPNVDVMFKSWLKYGLHADVIFKNISKPLRAIRRVVATNLPANFLAGWLNDWKNELDKYETIIIHASEWTTIAFSYKTLYLNKVIYIMPEYRTDGLSQAGRKMRLKNLQGALLNCELHMNKKIIFSFRLKKAILKICYSFFLHKRIKEIINTTQYKILIIISIPAGYLLYLYWHKKYGVDEKC